jgi:anti-sigma factor RsiW
MQPLDPAIREQLVAYLDGELDAENSRRIEDLLANDPQVRAALQGLDRTWELLDELDTPPVREGFTQTTLEMVAVAAAKDAQQIRSDAPRRRRQRRLLVVAGLLWTGLAGFLIARTVLPDPNRELLQDLPLLENLDQYRELDSLDFLRLLIRNKLFVEEGDAGGSEPADSLAQRRDRIKAMSTAQKENLLNRQQQFSKLEPAERQRVRQLHDQLRNDPEAARLREVLTRYYQWLTALPEFRQLQLKEAPPEQRIQQIKKIQQTQAASAASQLDPPDREALRLWIDRYVRQHEARLLEMVPANYRRNVSKVTPEMRHRWVLALIYQRWKRVGAPALAALGSGELASLRAGLSPPTRARLEALPTDKQWQMVAEWIGQVSVKRPSAGPRLPNLDEQLAHFFEFHLDDETRDRLMSLPGDEMQQRLRDRFDRFQHPNKAPASHPPRPNKTGNAAKPKEPGGQ